MRQFAGNENGQGQYWVFTINNPTDDDISKLNTLVDTEGSFIGFVRYSLEHADGEGTPHFQGHLECTKRVRRSQLSGLLPRAYLAIRKGSFEQCEEYCLKEGGETHVFGERVSKGKGARTDLDQLAEEIRNGRNKRDLMTTYGKEFIKYSKGIDCYFDAFRVKKFESLSGPFLWNIEVSRERSQIFWGAAGIGKTEYAKYLLPNALFVSHLDDLGAFNEGYDGIIFDDMAFDHLPRTSQIHILDMDNDRSIHIRYKTASIPAHTPKIFLTNVIDGRIFDLTDSAISRRVEVHNLKLP